MGCELLGTAVLLLGGLSAVTLDFSANSPVASALPSHSLRLLLTGSLFATTGALVTISPLGRRSGAHLNPAVTFAFWMRRHLHPYDLAGYVVSQCLGALLGAFAVRELWGWRAQSVHDGLTLPARHLAPIAAAAIEAGMTAALIFTIFVFVSSSRSARWTPLAAAVVVALLVWQGAPLTGTSLNPARSLGPAVVASDFHDYWCYVVGPLAGSALAVAGFALLRRETQTAKIFHDSRYRSVFASLLPVRH